MHYEGDGLLCNSRGKLGHTKRNCPQAISTSAQQDLDNPQAEDLVYEPTTQWTTVTFKKTRKKTPPRETTHASTSGNEPGKFSKLSRQTVGKGKVIDDRTLMQGTSKRLIQFWGPTLNRPRKIVYGPVQISVNGLEIPKPIKEKTNLIKRDLDFLKLFHKVQ